MTKISSLIFIVLGFLILIFGVYFSYKNYYPLIINNSKDSQIISNNSQNNLYFQAENKLFSINTDNSLDRLITNTTPLTTSDFSFDPTLSPDKTKNVKAEKNDDSSTNLNLTDLQTNRIEQLFKVDSNNIVSQLNYQTNGIFYLTNNQTSSILNLFDFGTNQNKTILTLNTPNEIANYNISKDANSVVLQIKNNQTNENNIQVSQIKDGSSLQLTTDGQSFYPVFSPEGDQIAFWHENDGIYKININKTGLFKIYNYPTKIDQIFTWR